MKALGYSRVSTADQGESRAGLDAQHTAIQQETARRGLELLEIHEDVASGASTRRRPELSNALRRLEGGEAQVLVVARLSRLARSTKDILTFVELSRSQGWLFVPLDYPQFDTSKAVDKMLVTIMAAVDEFQRELGAEVTRDALQAIRANGKRLGRRVQMSPETEGLIVALKAEGLSFEQIARRLDVLGVCPPRAERWSGRSVWGAYSRLERERPAEAGRKR